LKTLQIARGFKIEERGTGALLKRLAQAAEKAGPENTQSGELIDLVYLDPPWEAEAEYAKTMELLGIARGRAMLAPGALVVAEHSSKAQLAERYGELAQTRTLKQGDASLSFYAVADR
jgi:16S rRNA G966 N2-methylase RsmD